MRQCDMKWRTGSYYHKGNSKLCFGAPEIISGTPKQLAARLKAREGLHSEVVAPEDEKARTKNKNKLPLYTDRFAKKNNCRKRK